MDETRSERKWHKGRKKGARSNFYRRKNDERHRQATSKENPPPSVRKYANRISVRNPLRPLQLASCTFENLKLETISTPDSWKVFSDSTRVEYYQLKSTQNGMLHVATNVIIHTDLSWNVIYRGMKVSATCNILTEFPQTITDSRTVQRLLERVDQAVICPGNPEDVFVAVCKKRGGTIKGQRGHGDTVAFIDESPVTDSKGQSHPQTVRRVDCDILCEPSNEHPLPCQSCRAFRSTLRSAACRINTVDRTAASSHASYASLSPKEKDKRLQNVHQSLRLANQQIRRLEAKVDSLISKDGISLHEDDATDMSTVFSEVNSIVTKSFPPNTPQRIFWEHQMTYNQLKDKRQMRWHPLVLRFALNLKYMSTSAYRAVRQSGIINLPSERTLSDYTHWVSAHSGVQIEFIEHFKHMMESDVSPSEKHQCAVSMDEMKIKTGLVFSRRTGSLVGFVDLGSANRDIERLTVDDTTDFTTHGQLADQVLVFMARAVFKPSLAVPIAHYPSLKLSGKHIIFFNDHIHVIKKSFFFCI